MIYEVWKKTEYSETDGGMRDEDYVTVQTGSALILVPLEERENWEEQMAEDSQWQDYSYQVNFEKVATFTSSEIGKLWSMMRKNEGVER